MRTTEISQEEFSAIVGTRSRTKRAMLLRILEKASDGIPQCLEFDEGDPLASTYSLLLQLRKKAGLDSVRVSRDSDAGRIYVGIDATCEHSGDDD